METTTIGVKHFHVRNALRSGALRFGIEGDPMVKDILVARLDAFLAGEEKEVVYGFSGRWEAFLYVLFGEKWARRRPLFRREVKIKVCPHIEIPRHGQHIHFLKSEWEREGDA